MMIRPGSYDISVRAPGRETFEQKICAVAGKTLKLRPELRVQSAPAPTVRWLCLGRFEISAPAV
jgi:hypothetical protein